MNGLRTPGSDRLLMAGAGACLLSRLGSGASWRGEWRSLICLHAIKITIQSLFPLPRWFLLIFVLENLNITAALAEWDTRFL